MNCTTKLHLYDVAEDGQSATCLCGKGDPITVPKAPEWAEATSDMVGVDEWTGTLDDWDLDNIEWRAEVDDRAYDGSCECWSISYGKVELSMGDLTLQWGDCGEDVAKWMRALRRAALAFDATEAP